MTPTVLLSRRRVLFTIGATFVACLASPGCGPGDNEGEFLRSAPTGKASEIPDEKVADRRSRTKRVTAIDKKIEARSKAAEKAAAEKAAKAAKK